MLASNDTCASVMPLQADVALEEVILDQDSRATSRPCIAFERSLRWLLVIIEVAHVIASLHLDVECVACEVGHIAQEPVVFHHNVRLATVAELWVLDVNSASRRADIVPESVSGEDHWALITFDHDSCHVLQRIHDQCVVELGVWVDHRLEEIVRIPQIVHAHLEL